MQPIQQLHKPQPREITVVQFGQGNFLRGFADWMLDIANEKGVCNAGVAIIKSTPRGNLDQFKEQHNLFTVRLEGRQDGEPCQENRVVTCVQQTVDCNSEPGAFFALAALPSLRFVLSNTTEAGIVFDPADIPTPGMPAQTFPGKLAQLLFARYTAFSGAADKGLLVLPCELIENNGEQLQKCVLQYAALWQLPAAFAAWVENNNTFCNTLVDRIVTGFPRQNAAAYWQQLGYRDDLLVVGEPFAQWVIESANPAAVRALLPLDSAGLPVVFTDNLAPYRESKVRILNGGHTGMALAAYLAGVDTVGECMNDATVRRYLVEMIEHEILPTVKLPRPKAAQFAAAVYERFDNPFIRHELLSISLNSVSKWKTRVLPSLLDSLAATDRLPQKLVFSFAALLAFYRSATPAENGLVGRRGKSAYTIQDNPDVLAFFRQHSVPDNTSYIKACAQNTAFWGQDLSKIDGFLAAATYWLRQIEADAKQAIAEVCDA